MEEAPFWQAALQQMPALTISLAAFIFMTVKAMRFFKEIAGMFSKTLHEVGENCHLHSTQREELMHAELRAGRKAMERFNEHQARNEQVLSRLASVLERQRSA